MTEVHVNEELLKDLRGRVVVLTGGAQGIGRATLSLLHSSGANVIFGDWSAEKGQQAERELNSESGKARVHFLRADVRQYKDLLALFDLAVQEYGHVDCAVSCAAVAEPDGWFEPADLNLDTVRKEPTAITSAVDINLTSVISFCRIALAYLSSAGASKATTNGALSNGSSGHSSTPFSKSILLISSVAGITEAPGLFAYSSAKHGVIGLMRALRPWAPIRYNIRANAICPWATDTQLLSGVRTRWADEKLPLNQPEDVAKFVVNCLVDNQSNGQAIFVAGGRGFDTEAEIERLQPQWLGDLCDEWRRGQTVLGLGDDWVKHEVRQQ